MPSWPSFSACLKYCVPDSERWTLNCTRPLFGQQLLEDFFAIEQRQLADVFSAGEQAVEDIGFATFRDLAISSILAVTLDESLSAGGRASRGAVDASR